MTTRIRAVKIHLPSDDLGTTVVRGIGFRGECGCGWKSGRCASYAMARGALADHKTRFHRG
jgi:hypothetical protein